MELSVSHKLEYKYTSSVYLEPQTIYLMPRLNPYQRLTDFFLDIIPRPSLISKNVDAEGNLQYIAHFYENTDSLEVKSGFKIDSPDFNPLQFLIYPFESAQMPLQYSSRLGKMLKYYLRNRVNQGGVKDYTAQIQSSSYNNVMDFLGELTKRVSSDFEYEFREKGKPLSPDALLKRGRGACRDFANLFLEVCRRSGIAARFVSGYFHGDTDQGHHLHGWVEVYLPGAGWRGIDPTQGVWVDEKYVALAASPDPEKVAPVIGSFRGVAKAKIKTEVSITQNNYLITL